jgi:hypothetical protein
MPRRIDGNNALYHYLQKVIIPRDDEFSRELVRRLILDLSIWFPVDLYRAVPVLLPFCVRDSSVKSKEWGSASPQGCLRDNNSALKLLVTNYAIQSPRTGVYPRASRGHGFVASHAWRRIRINGHSQYATTHPRTYSFIPNLAWLPAQVAKLTDHEGSYAQQVLQAISHALYAPFKPSHPVELASIWEALPPPELQMDVDVRQLNYFAITPRSISIRRNNLLREIGAVEETLSSGQAGAVSPRSARYLPSLAAVPREQAADLLDWLAAYKTFLYTQT